MNRCSITGRLGRDPELKKTTNGISSCNFSLAVERPFARDGEQDTDWINVQSWRQNAEYITSFARKGDIVGVEGRIQTRKYNDKTYTEIAADRIEILHTVAKEDTAAETKTSHMNSSSRSYAGRQMPTATPEDIAQMAFDETGEEIDPDELPF